MTGVLLDLAERRLGNENSVSERVVLSPWRGR